MRLKIAFEYECCRACLATGGAAAYWKTDCGSRDKDCLPRAVSQGEVVTAKRDEYLQSLL